MNQARIIDRSSDSQVYADLRGRLESGRLAQGAKLPSLRKLMNQFNLPYQSVREAIVRLEHEGLVVMRQGSGVYVKSVVPRVRNILLLSRTEGDVWSDMTLEFVARFSNHADVRLMVEQVPVDEPGRVSGFERKLAAIIESGLDAVLINGVNAVGPLMKGIMDRVPVVVHYSRELLPRYTGGYVITDWRHGGYIGTRHLIEVGCRHIALVVPPLDPTHPTDHHFDFIRGAEAAANDSIHRVCIQKLFAGYDDPSFEARFMEWIRSSARPDAVFAHADFRAAPLIPMIQRAGLEVPDDIAVLGYYDTPWTMMTYPRLSSISTFAPRIAAAAADMVIDRRFEEQSVISPALVIRESTLRRPSPPNSRA